MAASGLNQATSGSLDASLGDQRGRVTPLQEQLRSDGSAGRATPIDALRLAVRRFHAGQRIDIQAIARELGVSRITVHRWVGTREDLLTETLWSVSDRALSALAMRTRQEPGSRTAAVLTIWIDELLAHPGIRQLQDNENDLFTRLTTRDISEFQRRLIHRVHEMLAADRDAARLTIELDLDDLAYTTVRIAEAFIHTRAITGEAPDPRRAERVLRAFLG